VTADTSYYTTLNSAPMKVRADGSRAGSTAEWTVCATLVPDFGQSCKDVSRGTIRVGDGVTQYQNLVDSATYDVTGGAL
jgi:hypothetical protein